MKIAIQPVNGSFSDRWIEYCISHNINYKLVDCYKSDIIEQLEDCDALMWHFHHASAKNSLFVKQLLFAIQHSGKIVFPDFNTVWHFDDKVGQKYLLESLDLPLVNSTVFYSKQDALNWAHSAIYPKVFKLRGGAGSVNVKLVRSLTEAQKLIKKAFGRGFKHDSIVPFSEVWGKYKLGKVSLNALVRSFARVFVKTEFAKIHGKEIGYIYYQDYIPDNDSDIRVIVIGGKAFALKRMVRENDFRASGSGKILYDKKYFDDTTIALAFEIHEKLNSQCTAMDFVYDLGQPKIVEISYGFSPNAYDACTGYWDRELSWHEGTFNPYGWMVDNILKSI